MTFCILQSSNFWSRAVPCSVPSQAASILLENHFFQDAVDSGLLLGVAKGKQGTGVRGGKRKGGCDSVCAPCFSQHLLGPPCGLLAPTGKSVLGLGSHWMAMFLSHMPLVGPPVHFGRCSCWCQSLEFLSSLCLASQLLHFIGKQVSMPITSIGKSWTVFCFSDLRVRWIHPTLWVLIWNTLARD